MAAADPASSSLRADTSAWPRVAAILVVSDGIEWLGNVLATIAAQRYPALDLVVVNNASRDGSADVLARRIPADRLVTLRKNQGFARAVGVGLQHEAVASADLILLLHDDLALARDALARMVRALLADPSLSIVGPKLREWSEEKILQQVGMTTDRFGRAESGLERGELDQGQHDQQRDVLYVSTAGMLLRREALAEIGGFDVRFPAFRDDLDLCWRAWVLGHRVGVVPEAVGYHIAASFRGDRRVGSGRATESRYLAERNSLAALLKNYGAGRLLWVVPVLLVLAAGKVVGFVATRRMGAALAVVRAYLWNLVQLPGTLRRRRYVQSRRTMGDSELDRLMAAGMPRFRAYLEALGEWFAGGSTRALLDDTELARAMEAEVNPVVRAVRNHPVASAGAVLGVIYLFGLVGLLGGGQIIGGQIAPWPDSALDFLRAYASPWNGEPVASEAFASPIQALIGLASLAGMGSAWLAQRLLVFGLLPLAWMLMVRASRLITSWPAPRIVGATLYVLSPAVLGALAQGRFGTLVASALLPGLVLVGTQATEPGTPLSSAWRSAALLALGLATVIAATPGLGPFIVVALAALGVSVVARGSGPQPLARLVVAAGSAFLLLSPWLYGLLRTGAPPRPPAPEVSLPLWRAFLAVPTTLPGAEGIPGIVVAASAMAVLVGALLLALRQRPDAVAGLLLVIVVSGLVGWGTGELRPGWVWPSGLLLPAALAYAGLAVLAGRSLVGTLGGYAFGARQLAAVAATVVVGVGLVAGIARLGGGPWEGLALDPELVPAFVAADQPRVGDYRVLLLDEDEGEVRWDVVGAAGPSMVSFGASADRSLLDHYGDLIAAMAGEADPRAGAQLGVANVRYLVVTDAEDADLIAAVGRQPALEPLPSGGGRVFRVQTWLPRAVALPPAMAVALQATGDPGPTAAIEEQGLRRLSPDVYRGPVDEAGDGGLLVLGEASSELWQARATGSRLERVDIPGVNAFDLPPGAPAVTVRVAGGAGHRIVVGLQLLLALAVLSLALRPPRFGRERGQRLSRRLPAELEAAADETSQPTGPAGGSS